MLPMFKSIIARFYPTAWEPAKEPNGYQYDLDGALRYNRFATGRDYFPTVGGDGTIEQIGMVSGFMMQRDASVWAGMTAKKPSGPFSTTEPVNLQWQASIPGLAKSY